MYLATIAENDNRRPIVVGPDGWVVAAEELGASAGADAMDLLADLPRLAHHAELPAERRRPVESFTSSLRTCGRAKSGGRD